MYARSYIARFLVESPDRENEASHLNDFQTRTRRRTTNHTQSPLFVLFKNRVVWKKLALKVCFSLPSHSYQQTLSVGRSVCSDKEKHTPKKESMVRLFSIPVFASLAPRETKQRTENSHSTCSFFVAPKATTQLPLTCKCVKLCLPIGYAYSPLHFFLVCKENREWPLDFPNNEIVCFRLLWLNNVRKEEVYNIVRSHCHAKVVKEVNSKSKKENKTHTKQCAFVFCLNEK